MALFVDITKKLDSYTLNMRFEASDCTTALLGASGSGKSMTLKCIAGIETPDSGRIELNGRVLYDSDKKINLSPQKRRVGYLFQQYALFPNMTVEQNIACGVRDKAQRKVKTAEMIARMKLTGLERRKPALLSGGQQQRVALARILVNEPEVLLLDEPFSALDSQLRFRMEQEVREIIADFGKPVILVSHDRDEVYRLSENIALLKDGVAETVGTKYEVFANPVTVNGAVLTGCKNISAIHKIDDTHIYAVEWGVNLSVDHCPDEIKYAGIRMHDLDPGGTENVIRCRVAEELEAPFSYIVRLVPAEEGGSEPFGMQLSKEKWEAIRKEELDVAFPTEKILLLRG